jgi:uncharacterized protein
MPLSFEEGRTAVGLARTTLDEHVSGGKTPPKEIASSPFSEMRGVFVTLNIVDPSRQRLRGCIGFPYPVKRLDLAIQEATIAAASEDPRFKPVAPSELDKIVVEVSVLTSPKELDYPREALPSKVRIGEDGLIISRTYTSGLLLPQVATEYGLSQLEFLSQACIKAGLPPDAWLDGETKVQAFQAEVFTEESPRGGVIRATDGAARVD